MPLLPPKKSVALELLERTSVFVHLDPRRPGVVVPREFLKQPQLVLQIGLNMAIQIPDLEVTDTGITCTLSFNRRPQYCVLPWSAIYALIGEQGGGMVWPEDVPPEVVSQRQAAAKKDVRRPNLRALDPASADRKAKPASEEKSPRSAPPERLRSDAPARKAAPHLVQVVSNPAPEADTAVQHGQAGEASREGGRDEASRPTPSKRARPPYLRLVD